MNRFSKALLLAGSAAVMLTVSACSDVSNISTSETMSIQANSRAIISGANSSINVTEMSSNKMTISYNAGSQKSSVKLYVSEGNGKGLILANQSMNYSNGTYSYTVSHPTFTANAKIYVCVLVNDNGVEKCVPQGNLADTSSWGTVTYGKDDSSSNSSSSSSSTSTNNENAYNLGNGTFFFIAKCSNKALDVSDRSTTHGANVHQWTYGDQTNQHWILSSTGDGYYYIISQNSGLCLDVDNWGKNAGANVLQWDVGNNQANQKWKFVIQSDNSFKVVNQNSGLVLDVSNSSKDDGANVQQWTWNGSDAQKWFITKISDSTSTGTPSNNTGSSSGNNSNTSNLMAGATNGTSVGSSGYSFIGSGNSFSKLVWSDEFEGTSLNRSNWTFDTGNGGWGNSELQNYTNGSNVKVGNGVMTITADNNLTSTRIKSAGLKQFQYGKIEARIKTDQGTGSWPAFWMLGTGSNYQWPYCGEIDIMEHANNDNFVFETCHWNGNGKNTNSGYNHASWGQTTNNNYWNVINSLDVTQWHTYGIEWTPAQIRFYVDGKQVMACDIGNAANGTDCFNQPFYILFNFAMGGQFTGIYNANQFSGMPWHMYVDYVRCYQ